MAKYITYELHLVELETLKLRDGEYRQNVVLRDWDDGQVVRLTIITPFPITTVQPWKVRVLTEQLEESLPTAP